MSFSTLPYDLLLNVASYLDVRDIHALHLTCKALHDFSTTRPTYRKLANNLLRRCRALPLKGFQRLSDLTTEQLIRSVNKAAHYEFAWAVRAPRPIRTRPETSGPNPYSNYMDVTPNSRLARRIEQEGPKWYKVVSAPPDEKVDWLSPITSSYTLCATKSGKVVCWDVQSDMCLAEWNPGEKWELWKCRVEFEERTVFFTMAHVEKHTYDDNRLMKFVLMRLTFSDGPSGMSSPDPPVFSRVTEFRTTGVVMNVFLLDPSERLLSAFIWVASTKTIGLYALPDWDENTYVFIDTGIECAMSSNWSCILYEKNIVIHCEETDAAFQHFYPISLLMTCAATLTDSTCDHPEISRRLTPARTLTRKFKFPYFSDVESEPSSDSQSEADSQPDNYVDGYTTNDFLATSIPILNGNALDLVPSPSQPTVSASSPSSSSSSSSTTAPPPTAISSNPNPFPSPPWYPESAHFVRQWWPTLPSVPRVSCTVVLLAIQDADPRRTRFVLAQHYFQVPLDLAEWENWPHESSSLSNPPATYKGKEKEASQSPNANGHTKDDNSTHHAGRHDSPTYPALADDVNSDALMRLWYVSTPFEVVRIMDETIPPEADPEDDLPRPRPLVAVDFGHAVWIEYIEQDDDRREGRADDDDFDQDPKWLRFVTFPPFSDDYENVLQRCEGGIEGKVRTIETPDELDLGRVETINIDQSQGAVILSDKDGRIFILCYE